MWFRVDTLYLVLGLLGKQGSRAARPASAPRRAGESPDVGGAARTAIQGTLK